MMINTNNNLCKEVSKRNASYKKERLSCLLLYLAVFSLSLLTLFFIKENLSLLYCLSSLSLIFLLNKYAKKLKKISKEMKEQQQQKERKGEDK